MVAFLDARGEGDPIKADLCDEVSTLGCRRR